MSFSSFAAFLTRCVRIALVALLTSAVPVFAGTIFSPTMENGSNVDIRLESWLESLPHTGFVPVRLTIRNGEAREHTWAFHATNSFGMSGGMNTLARLTVPAGHTRELTVYAATNAQPDSGYYYYGNLIFLVRGPGVNVQNAGSLPISGGYGSHRTVFIGMGKRPAAKGWSALRNRFTSGSRHSSASELCGSEVDMTRAPEDWRGYTGLAQLWMDESEWLGMTSAAKMALLDWVTMGGRVVVLATEASEAKAEQLGMPRMSGSGPARRHGTGGVTLMRWDGQALPLDQMVAEIRSAERTALREQLGDYDKKWALRDLVGPLTLRGGLIFGFIVVFGVLIGPVNLFVLAPAGHRQRMFWTTPLLSLAGSLVLLAVMVLQDGIGGEGARLAFVILQPEQKRMSVMQEQVSKTGVLLGRTFAKAEASWMQPVELSSRPTFNPAGRSQRTFSESEGRRSGDWFASRSVQAQMLQTVRPGRAAVEFFASADDSAPPSVLSTVDSPLTNVFAVDAANRVWRAQDLGTGEKKIMLPATREQLDKWLTHEAGKLAGPVLSTALNALRNGTSCVFAEASEPSKLAIVTLPDIRWTTDRAFIFGPLVQR